MATPRNNTPSGVHATGVPIPHPRLVELIKRRALRQRVERVVSRLIAVLDDLDVDPEAEPWLGAGVVLYPAHDDQRLWAISANDDREQENEDGGDILDEPHDEETDDDLCCEPSDNGIADADGLAEQCREYDGRLAHSVGGYVA